MITAKRERDKKPQGKRKQNTRLTQPPYNKQPKERKERAEMSIAGEILLTLLTVRNSTL